MRASSQAVGTSRRKPRENRPSFAAAVPVQLDLLGEGTVELAPGTWTFVALVAN